MRLLRTALLALTTALLLVSSRAAFARASLTLRGAPGEVSAGDVVLLEWSEPPGDVREMELELRIDGGPWVRISPELESGERAWVWRVPDVAAARAELRLCMGGEGFERDVPMGEAFRIRAQRHPGPPRPRSLEAWHGWDLSPGCTESGLRDGQRSSLSPRTQDAAAECHSTFSAEGPDSRAARLPHLQQASIAGAVRHIAAAEAPRLRPMRN